MNRRFLHTIGAWLLTGVFIAGAYGQVAEQTFQLDAGWNSIFLEVNAIPAEANAVFAGQPIESVWMRAPEPQVNFGLGCTSPEDPDCVSVHDTLWRVWYPPSTASGLVTSLRVIRGGNAYLIKATAATTLTVRGIPNAFDPRYRPGYNLRGFYVVDDPGATPTIGDYLQPETALDATAVYRTQTDGSVAAVADTTQITPGVGYWVPSSTDLAYNGPLDIDVGTLRGVDFGKTQLTHTISLVNRAAATVDVTATYVSSQTPTPAGVPTYAGDVPLFWLDYGGGSTAADIMQWHSLGSHTTAVAVGGNNGLRTTVDIGVSRVGLAGATLDAQGNGSTYQGLLELSDDAGFQRLIPITAEADAPASGTVAGVASTDRPGLYLGTVTVDQVAWVTAGARVWTNDDAANPTFDGLTQCVGGDNVGELCVAGRKRCMGDPEIDRINLVCEDNADCPVGTTCETDCPGGECRGFCIGGDLAGQGCVDSNDCASQGGISGTCSVDLDKAKLRPVTYAFEFPVIVHLSEFGEYKLLTEVALLATANDELVLQTPDCAPAVCDSLQGALTSDGEPFAPRVSTAAFSFEHDLLLDAGRHCIGGDNAGNLCALDTDCPNGACRGGGFTSRLAGSTVIAPDDPLNPFRHKFHPDHDCLDQFGDPLAGNALVGECFDVTRSFVFSFEPQPPDGRSVLDWGDSVVGGVYTEHVSGLHKETITARGRFELRRVATIGLLNTPVVPGGQP